MEKQGKVCTKCGEWKFLEEYNKSKHSKDGKQSACRECQKEYKKQWKENNKEHIKKYAKQWREGNEEYRKEYSKQWKENNPEYSKQHYQNNKECYKEQNKQWRENNKEHRKEYMKQWGENNKEHIREYRENNKEHIREYQKQYRENNEEHIREWDKQYRENNKERIREQRKEYRENNKEHIKRYKEQYYQNNKQNNLQYISSIVEQINPTFKRLNLPVYGYIYKFKNTKTGRCYIGQTITSLKHRYNNDIIKGWIKERLEKTNQKFKEELIEKDIVVTETLDIAFCQYHLDKLEAYYIDKYDSYNNGYNNNAGYHITDDGIEEFEQILKNNGLQFIDGKLVKIA